MRRIARGGTAAETDFLDPVGGSPLFAVCVYDDSPTPQPLSAATIASGGTCDGHPCWRHSGGAGRYRWKSRAGNLQGMRSVKLGATRAGQLKLALVAKGPNLVLPSLGLTPPVRLQLQVANDDTTICWEASFASPARNDAGLFKATTGP